MGRMTRENLDTLWTAGVMVSLFAVMVSFLAAAGIEAIDDAYISFRYALNLIDGNGLVYNPGEAVQGYTNFLWVILLAGAMWAGLPPVPFGFVLGALAGASVVVLTVIWSMRRLAPGRTSAYVAPVLLVSNFAVAVWSTRGLETGLFTLLILAASLLYLRRGPERPFPAGSAVLLVLATLTRPEGGLVFGILVLHLLLARLRIKQRLLTRPDLAPLAVFGLSILAYALWAYLYYGDPLPNTFRAKVGGGLETARHGMEYLWKFYRYGTGLPLLILPVCFLFRERRDWTRSLAALLVTVYTSYVVAVGGDVFPAYRFLVPIFPFLYLLAGDGMAVMEEQASRFRPLARSLGVMLILAFLALQTSAPSRAYGWREWNGGNRFTTDLRMVGRWLRGNVRPGTWIALNPAGAVPFESGLPAIDMLGLNDRVIGSTPMDSHRSRLVGHARGNGPYVLGRQPEIILFSGVHISDPARPKEWRPRHRSEEELERMPEFWQQYVVEQHPLPDGRVLSFMRLRGASISRPADPPERQ